MMNIIYLRTICCASLFNQYSSVLKSAKAEVYKHLNVSSNLYYSTKGLGLDPPWRIIFFGTDDFALRSVQPLCAKLRTGTLMSDLAVVARPGSVVRQFAESEKLPIIEWPLKSEVIKGKFDLGIVVSFGHLIPKNIISAIPLGILNVHGSLLPRWRGAAPILYAVMNADPETGVTIMKIEPHKFDTGDIVRQYRCAIGLDETTPQLTARLAEQGAKLLMECIRDLPRCLEMATPQPTVGVTYAPRVTMELSVVNWTAMGAKEVYDLHRAISHLYALTTSWHGIQTRLIDIKIESSKEARKKIPSESSSKSALQFLNSDESTTTPRYFIDTSVIQPGQIFYNKLNRTMKIQCADGMCVSCGGLRLGGLITMPYIIVRGSLGMANTRVYGLGDEEINEIKNRLRVVGKDDMKDEVTLYNSVVYVLNQLEYHFGYRVITCTCQGDMVQPMWTLSRPTMRA